MADQTSISIQDAMGAGTHPAVVQNIRNLAQQLRSLSASVSTGQSSSASAASVVAQLAASIATIQQTLTSLQQQINNIVNTPTTGVDVLQVASLLPPPPLSPVVFNDSQNILANQIFGP